MKMNQTSELPTENACLWTGRPEILPYLLVNCRLFTMTIALAVVCWYMRFRWNPVTMVCTIFYGFHVAGGIVSWRRVRYYITGDGPCVRKNGVCYQWNWSELSKEDCRIVGNPLNSLFHCRTIQFAKQYGYTSNRGPNTNLLRETARFWCIREYHEIDEMIQRYVYK